MKARIGVFLLAIGLAFGACAEDSDTASPGESPEPTAETLVLDPPPPLATSVAGAAPAPASNEPLSCRGEDGGLAVGRTDIRVSGNRQAPGSIDLLNVPMVAIDLPAPPTWIVPFFAADDSCEPYWYVTLNDGRAVTVDPRGVVADAGAALAPPETSSGVVRSVYDDLGRFDNPLPDSRVVSFGSWSAALVDPTERYGHGVLGDRIEAGAIEVIDNSSGERTRIMIDAPSVIEGISPMLLDVDQSDDAIPEILVTLSNADDGAWLALFNIDGTLRAASAPIGRGNRWRNQLGAGWTGPDGDYEIVDVRTPHLDGVVEFFRVNGDRLELTASTSGYTNHTLGSRNLDLGIMVDADADKVVEVVLPTRDLGSLAIIDRHDDDAIEVGRIDLGGSLSTNIATQWIVGQSWIAVGTQDARLLVFGDPNLLTSDAD